jgi:hypothetical protein
VRIAPPGTLARHTPWYPSQPAMKSQRSSCSAPSDRQRTLGASLSKPCTLTPSASYTVVRPAPARASIKSCVTSVWP